VARGLARPTRPLKRRVLVSPRFGGPRRKPLLDGASCIVIEAQRYQEFQGTRKHIVEKIWFGPKLGYAPRKWEETSDGNLCVRRTNSKFEEAAPDCWVPKESSVITATPSWVAKEYRNQPAYSQNIRLKKAKLNDLPDSLFKPKE
jgi:hypothetical protein